MIMTKDCPIGLKVRRKLAGWVGRTAAVFVFVGGMLGLFRNVMGESANTSSLARLEPFATIQRWLDPAGATGLPPIAGEIFITPAPPTPKPMPTAADGAS